LSLEEKLIDLLVFINYTLLFPRKVKLPVHEHSISTRDSWFSVLDVKLVEAKKASDNAGEINEVGEGAEDRGFVFEVSSFVFRKCPRTGDYLPNC